jgi:SAM-dependent methyltransferase
MISGQQPTEVQKTVEGFGWEWLTFNEPIQDSYMTGKTLFLDFIYPVKEDAFQDKIVLDAGCGMGRFLKLGAEFGSREIIGVDLSDSVEAAYQNTRHLPNAHVVQADIYALPFRRGFDYIFSVGVLHHLSNPREGFDQLVMLLKKDGRISAWVYGKENNGWVIYLLTPLRKYITSRLPKPVLYGISHLLGFTLFAMIKLIYKPVNEIFRAGRLLPYNDYFYYTSRLSYSSLVNVVFDHLVPQLTHYISREEFESWFREEKLWPVTITSRNNMSWRGLGVRGQEIPKVPEVSQSV